MKNYSAIVLLLISSFAKSQTTNNIQLNAANFNLNIELDKDTISNFDTSPIAISITNKSAETQKILFDKLSHAQIGPWGISIIVFDTINKKLIDNQPPNFYASTAYFSKDIVKFYRELRSKETASLKVSVSKISNIKTLPKGNYQLQIRYNNLLSNKVTIVVL